MGEGGGCIELLKPTGTLKTFWGIQGLVQNRAKLTKIGGVPLFRSICVLFVLPRVSNEQVSSKQRGPVSPNINKRPPSRSLFWSIWGPLPLLDPCYGQYTMLTNYHGPVSPNINEIYCIFDAAMSLPAIWTPNSPVKPNSRCLGVIFMDSADSGWLFLMG